LAKTSYALIASSCFRYMKLGVDVSIMACDIFHSGSGRCVADRASFRAGTMGRGAATGRGGTLGCGGTLILVLPFMTASNSLRPTN
jgi:hypothetical protein